MQRKLLGALVAAFVVAGLMAVPMVAFGELVEDATTCDDAGFPEANKVNAEGDGPFVISNGWGSATWDDDDDYTLDVDMNEGWTVEVCVKAGQDGVHVFTVTEDTELGPFGDNENGISHASWMDPVPPTDNLCDPADKPGGMDIAEWLKSEGFEASDCFEFEVSQSCGFLDAELTRNDTPFNYLFVWNYGDTPDLDAAQSFPANFEEDENGGTVEVTYYIVGPESDYFEGYGIPNFWDGGETVTVDTDCEEEPTTTTVPEETTTTEPPTTTTTQPPTTTTTVEDTTTTSIEATTTTTEATTTTTDPDDDEELPFTGPTSSPLALGGLALILLTSGLYFLRRGGRLTE